MVAGLADFPGVASRGRTFWDPSGLTGRLSGSFFHRLMAIFLRSSRAQLGVWLTALQLGNSQCNLVNSPRHQSRCDSGTLNRIVVRPAVWLMIPPVVNNR